MSKWRTTTTVPHIKMKLSRHSKYIEYGICLSKSDFAGARTALNQCIRDALRDNDILNIAFLRQSLAEVEFHLGNRRRALALHLKVEETNPHSPLVKLHFAKFLQRYIKDYKAANVMCGKVIGILSSETLLVEEDDLDRDYYLGSSYALRGYCYFMLNDINKAEENLKLLGETNSAYFVDHAFVFCEAMIRNGHGVTEAKTYLRRLSAALEKMNDDTYKEYADRVQLILDL